MRFLTIILFASLLYSCASSSPYKLGIGSVVKITESVPQGCRDIGEAYAYAKGDADEILRLVQYTRNQIRNEVAAKGGNLLIIQGNNLSMDSGKVYLVLSGWGYRCSGMPAPQDPNAKKEDLFGDEKQPEKAAQPQDAKPAEREDGIRRR